MEERRMTHQQVLRLGEALGREVAHHRGLAQSTEGVDDIIVRVLVTGYVDALEALWGDRDPRVVADRLRAHVNEQVEAQLTRLFPGQDIQPQRRDEVRAQEVQ